MKPFTHLVILACLLVAVTAAKTRLESPKGREFRKSLEGNAPALVSLTFLVPPAPAERQLPSNVVLTLGWTIPTQNVGMVKCRVYHGAVSRGYDWFTDVLYPTNWCRVTNAFRYRTNYWAVTCLSSNLESDYSVELAYLWAPWTNSQVIVWADLPTGHYTNLPPMTNPPGMGLFRIRSGAGSAAIQRGASTWGPWTNVLQWATGATNWTPKITRTNW